jgi:hypothetical protein
MVILDFQKKIEFDTVRISEYASRIQKYQIEVSQGDDDWKVIETGTSIGPESEVSLPHTIATKLRLDILDATDAPSIYEVRIFCK